MIVQEALLTELVCLHPSRRLAANSIKKYRKVIGRKSINNIEVCVYLDRPLMDVYGTTDAQLFGERMFQIHHDMGLVSMYV